MNGLEGTLIFLTGAVMCWLCYRLGYEHGATEAMERVMHKIEMHETNVGVIRRFEQEVKERDL